jgi:serine protease inhibitor
VYVISFIPKAQKASNIRSFILDSKKIHESFYALLLKLPFLFVQELQSSNTMLSMGHVVTTSVGMCDIDIRPVSFSL